MRRRHCRALPSFAKPSSPWLEDRSTMPLIEGVRRFPVLRFLLDRRRRLRYSQPIGVGNPWCRHAYEQGFIHTKLYLHHCWDCWVMFTGVYVLVDIYGYRKPTLVMEWLGTHALMVYILLGCNIFPLFAQGFYLREPENNIVIGIS
ncbi:hypothetical protein ZIOFF_068175 [Zingiber officinale]|uniref:Uncharacterized protein n=1 Tax=Zingiber officinale TaxID=94328 RepID=A0A8J5C6P5_ZINOF|nr:hypothetical protein ZIOFF_068175 [Zingiber officinale]